MGSSAWAQSASQPAPSPAAASGATVSLWHSYSGGEKDALDALVTAWNADPTHPHIDALAVPADSFVDKLAADIPRGEGPDLFIYAHDRLGDFVSSGLLQPVDFFVDQPTCDRFVRPTIDALTYGGSLWGLPLDSKSVALFYNVALIPTPPRTTADLVRMARAATDPASGRYGLVYEDEKLYFFAGWLFGFGGRLFDASGDLALDSPGAESAMSFARLLGGDGGVVPPEVTSAEVEAMFKSGQAAMAIDGPWLLGQLDGAPPFGVVPLPIVTPTGKPAAPFSGTEAVLMSSGARDPAAAWAVMNYLTSDASAVLRARQAGQVVANVAAYDDPSLAQNPILGSFKSQLASSTPMPSTPAMQSVWSIYDLALEKVVSHGADPHQALLEAQTSIQHLLDVADDGQPNGQNAGQAGGQTAGQKAGP
jgi:maltose-binding protein MalE